MSLLSLLQRIFSSQSTWPVIIVVDGNSITAVADKENEHGKWHITYEVPGVPHPISKWITPTSKQRLGRLEHGR